MRGTCQRHIHHCGGFAAMHCERCTSDDRFEHTRRMCSVSETAMKQSDSMGVSREQVSALMHHGIRGRLPVCASVRACAMCMACPTANQSGASQLASSAL